MRWEQIIGMRQQIDHIEVVSWNDVSTQASHLCYPRVVSYFPHQQWQYGESTYVGPIEGAMPTEAEAWATASCE